MRPLILITNDDGYAAKGLQALVGIAQEFGDILVMAPEGNSSGKSHSITTSQPLRVKEIKHQDNLDIYACNGTPVDCVKLGTEHFCSRKPALVLSGINHGSNSSINVLYSGTMGGVLEGSALGIDAIGFSLLNHSPEADFTPSLPYVRRIIAYTLEHGLPTNVSLNVNIPRLEADQIRGIRICHEAKAMWLDSYEKRIDPIGRPYWWLTGKFVCDNPPDTSDEWALQHGYISVVPTTTDFTDYSAIDRLKPLQL